MIIGFKSLTVGLLLLTISGLTTMGQQTSTRRQPPAVIKYDGDMATMVAHLPEIYGVTIGLEIDAQQPRAQVGFYLLDPTLPDVLNAIVKSAPRYQWRESDGFIEVFPSAGSSRLLDTMISSFQTGEVSYAEAIDKLVNLPELQANMRAMSLRRRVQGGTETTGKRISLNLEGVTVRQALHKIANDSGGRFWVFHNYSDGSFSISNSTQ